MSWAKGKLDAMRSIREPCVHRALCASDTEDPAMDDFEDMHEDTWEFDVSLGAMSSLNSMFDAVA